MINKISVGLILYGIGLSGIITSTLGAFEENYALFVSVAIMTVGVYSLQSGLKKY